MDSLSNNPVFVCVVFGQILVVVLINVDVLEQIWVDQLVLLLETFVELSADTLLIQGKISIIHHICV